VVTFAQHLERLRAGLERAVTAYNDAVGSFQARVRPAGERLAALGGGAPGRELPEPEPIAQGLRLTAGDAKVVPEETGGPRRADG
jgi:DNA recombination protein RmuC